MLYYNTNLELIGATLLSAVDAENFLTRDEREYEFNWWLCSPGAYRNYVCYVRNHGTVDYTGCSFNYGFCCIRPALMLSNSGTFKIGDIFNIGNHYFKIISPNLAWLYKQDIGGNIFDEKSNKYNKSHAKQVVNEWYEKLMEEIK